MSKNVVVIDGGMLEGGGQILRNAAALSCLLNIPITVNNIRAGRSTPGLRPQHLTGLCLLRDISHGTIDGAHVGSTEVTLRPRAIKGGNYTADTKTAGSICLLLQAALPCQLYGDGPGQLLLRGGTNAEMAPQIDYFTMVFSPIAARFGVHFECDIRKRGYFPKGGGEVMILTHPLKNITPVDMQERGNVVNITGRAFVAGNLPIKIARTMADVATQTIQDQYRGVPIHIEAVKEDPYQAVGNGTGIIITAETSNGCLLSGSGLGKRGVPAEDVGYKAAIQLMDNLKHGGCVDEYLQDQLLILMALASGTSRIRCGPITLHTQTAIEVAKILTKATFNIQEISKTQNILECSGIGLKNEQL